jgi:DNA adenine methylase
MKLPHPIQYQGSKRVLASTILRYFPNRFPRLVEPFAGTAAISIACAARGRANSYWINDLNKPLVELLGLIVNHPTEIVAVYEILWNQQHESITIGLEKILIEQETPDYFFICLHVV